MFLDPWQKSALTDMLGERDDGKWAASEVGILVPRQDGKGEILLVRELAGLFLFGESLILHSAHLFKTSQEHFRRVLAVIEGCHDLDKLVLKVRTAHGAEGIELKNGCRLNFMARSGGGGRGLGGDLIVMDEAFRLFAEMMAALYPTMAARPNPQIIFSSSAPLPGPESDELRRVCRRGRAGKSRRLCYLEHSADPSSDLSSDAAVAQANPGLGHRLTMEFVEQEREALSREDFERERLGVFPLPDADESGWESVPKAEWLAAENTASTIAGPMALTFDTSPLGDRGTVMAVGLNAAGKVHAEVVQHGPGTDWIAAKVAANAELTKAPVWGCRRGPAGELWPALEALGVTVNEVAQADVPAACQMVLSAVKEHGIAHLGGSEAQAPLTAAAKGAVARTVGDAFVWSRKSSGCDISPLYGLVFGLWGIRHPVDTVSIYEEQEMAVL